jgi:hypothetical protein
MDILHIYLDESGEFRFGSERDFIGGWICRRDDERQFLEASADVRQRLRAQGGGGIHMRDINNSDGSVGHSLYRELFQTLHPFVIRVVQTRTIQSQHLGPTEAWHKAIVQTMVEVLQAYPEPHYQCRFFVSTRLYPVWNWLFERDDHKVPGPRDLNQDERTLRNLYLKTVEETLVQECSEMVGAALNPNQLHFLKTNSVGDRALDEIADAFCTAQSGDRFFASLKWPASLFMRISQNRIVPSERAVLSRFLATGNDPNEVLWNLVVSGDVSGAMWDLAIKGMNERSIRWDVFCEIVNKRLLGSLSYGEDRYSNVNEYRTIAKNLPVQAVGAPLRLTWLQLRSLQKCDAHEGCATSTVRDELLKLLKESGEMIFPTSLAKAQGGIDVVIDDAQTRIVNPLRVDLIDGLVEKTLTSYMKLFPSAEYDQNIAKLSGTLGQYRALLAEFPGHDRSVLLAQAWILFEQDLKYCWGAQDKGFAFGYRTLIAFDQADQAKALEALDQEAECILGDHQDIALDRNINSTTWMARAYDTEKFFFLIHELQVRSLRGFSADGAVRQLAMRFMEIDPEQSITYPEIFVVKWVALHLFGSQESSMAIGIMKRALAKWKQEESYVDADSHIFASMNALLLEFEGNDGAKWWLEWAQLKLPPPQEHMVSFYIEKLKGLPQENLARIQNLATLLPFYFH